MLSLSNSTLKTLFFFCLSFLFNTFLFSSIAMIWQKMVVLKLQQGKVFWKTGCGAVSLCSLGYPKETYFLTSFFSSYIRWKEKVWHFLVVRGLDVLYFRLWFCYGIVVKMAQSLREKNSTAVVFWDVFCQRKVVGKLIASIQLRLLFLFL